MNGGGVHTWFVAPDELILIRMMSDDLTDARVAARNLKARYFIRKGAPPEHHFPQEWLVYRAITPLEQLIRSGAAATWRDKSPPKTHDPVKRLYSNTIDAAFMWCKTMEGLDGKV